MTPLADLGWTPSWQSAVVSNRSQKDLEPARVVEELKDLYRVRTAAGELPGGLTGRLRHAALSREELPAVGDWVAVFVRDGRATIHGVLPRRSALLRKVATARTESQVVAANVDTVFVLTSCNRDFNPRRVERYLSIVWDSGADPVVLLSKADLADDPDRYRLQAEEVACGVAVHVVSAHRGEGLAALAPYTAAGRTTALVGSSGVGKSTLINTLAGQELQHVKKIRADDARGRHTTTARQLVRLPGGALLIDTPGLREIALWGDTDSLKEAFHDIETLAARCRFRDCSHNGEPGCAVRAALNRGELDAARYESYGKLQRELAHLERRQSEHAFLEEKRRQRKLTAAHRKRTRR